MQMLDPDRLETQDLSSYKWKEYSDHITVTSTDGY